MPDSGSSRTALCSALCTLTLETRNLRRDIQPASSGASGGGPDSPADTEAGPAAADSSGAAAPQGLARWQSDGPAAAGDDPHDRRAAGSGRGGGNAGPGTAAGGKELYGGHAGKMMQMGSLCFGKAGSCACQVLKMFMPSLYGV